MTIGAEGDNGGFRVEGGSSQISDLMSRSEVRADPWSLLSKQHARFNRNKKNQAEELVREGEEEKNFRKASIDASKQSREANPSGLRSPSKEARLSNENQKLYSKFASDIQGFFVAMREGFEEKLLELFDKSPGENSSRLSDDETASQIPLVHLDAESSSKLLAEGRLGKNPY